MLFLKATSKTTLDRDRARSESDLVKRCAVSLLKRFNQDQEPLSTVTEPVERKGSLCRTFDNSDTSAGTGI